MKKIAKNKKINKTNKHRGSDFESFLQEDALLEEVETLAIKRVLAYQIQQQMIQGKLTKSSMASKMKTSRSALERLLDPENASVTLATLMKAARVLGKRLSVVLQ